MNRFHRYVLHRVVVMAVTAWFVLSLAFVVFAVKPDQQVWLALFGAGPSEEAQRAALQAYRQAHNYDTPLPERYARWMLNYATLRWGTTLEGVPIAALIRHALGQTLTYLVPSLFISTVTAHALGVYMAIRRGGFVDKVGTALAYAGYGVPAFFAAEMAFGILVHRYGMLWIPLDTVRAHQGVIVPPGIDEFLLPGAILTVHLIAIQLVFIRSEVVEHLNADFMKTLLASGARRRDLARHALRNAALPLISSFFGQILTILYLDIIAIEVAIGPHGFGALTFRAFTNQDLGLILGVTLVPIVFGLVGNFGQDLAFSVLDPRGDLSEPVSEGFIERFRSGELPRRTQAAVVVVAIGIVLAGGVAVVSGLGGLASIMVSDPADVDIDTPVPEQGLDVRIGYDGPWQLHLDVTVNGSTETRSIAGNGTEVIELDPGADAVRASVRKRDDSPSKLTLQIVHDGQLVTSESTTERYGAVQVTAEF